MEKDIPYNEKILFACAYETFKEQTCITYHPRQYAYWSCLVLEDKEDAGDG